MVDVIGHAIARAEANEVFHGGDEVLLGERALLLGDLEIEFLVDLVAADAAEIVALGVKEQALEHAARVLNGWRIARAELAVDVLESLVLVVGGVFFEGLDNRVVLFGVHDLDGLVAEAEEFADDRGGEWLERAADGDLSVADVGDQNLRGDLLFVEFLAEFEIFGFVEKLNDFLIARVAEGAEESGGQKFPAALATVEVNIEQVAGVELHLNPGPAVGNDAEAMQHFAICVDGGLEANAR